MLASLIEIGLRHLVKILFRCHLTDSVDVISQDRPTNNPTTPKRFPLGPLFVPGRPVTVLRSCDFTNIVMV